MLALAAGCGGAVSEAQAPSPASGTSSPSAGEAAPKNERMLETGSVGRAQADFDEASRSLELAANDCSQLCKALSSMSRAAERLCEIAKDGGDDGQRRCSEARAKVEAARARVRERCPACEPG